MAAAASDYRHPHSASITDPSSSPVGVSAPAAVAEEGGRQQYSGLPPPTDDVGMSLADEAERKLQLSLDELIEQTRGPPTTARGQTRTRGGRGGARLKYHPPYLGHPPPPPPPMLVPPPPGAAHFFPLPYRHGPSLRAHPYAAPGLMVERGMLPPTAVFGPVRLPPYGVGGRRVNGSLTMTSRGASSGLAAADAALSEIEILYPPMVSLEDGTTAQSETDALIVRFKGTEVLKVKKQRGELTLSSGGWRTLTTRLILNSALKPLGLWIEAETPTKEAPPQEDKEAPITPPSSVPAPPSTGQQSTNVQWTVVDGVSFLATFHDGMTVGQVGTQSHAHMLARASVIAQHLKQVKSDAIARRRAYRGAA